MGSHTFPALDTTNSFSGTDAFKYLNNIRMADQFPGADWGAKVNAADADLGATAGEIWVNQNAGLSNATAINITNNHVLRFIQGGTYNTSAGITLNTNASMFGVIQSTQINYTGSGAAITTTGGNTIGGIEVVLGASATEGFLLKGTEIIVEDYYVSGGGNSSKLLHVAAYNGTIQSGTIRLSKGRCFNYTGTGIYLDHVVDVFMSDISNFGAPANTTAIGFVIDTGVSGLYASNVEINQNGGGGLIVKSTTGGAGAYNQWPNYLWFTNFLVDAFGLVPNFDGVLFDSTLSTNPIYAVFENSWAVGHGLNGVHISGGQGIKFVGGTKIRFNGTNGILIDNANVSHVQVADSFITGNNTTNNGDAHGVYVTAACANISLIGNLIGNVLDTTGHQKFGWKVTAVSADDFIAIGNNLKQNETGYFSDSNTGSKQIVGNSSAAGISPSWFGGDVHVHGQVFIDSNTYASASINPAAAGGTDLGQAGLPWANIYLGAAATNNIKLTGTAAAARTATFQDQTGTVDLIVGSTSQKSETAADTNVLTVTPLAVVGSYRLRFVMSVSAANAATLGWTATWTDSAGNAQTPTNLSLYQSGVAAPALTFTTSVAGNYYGEAMIDTNNAGTGIVIKLTFSGTSFTAKVSATVERVI